MDERNFHIRDDRLTPEQNEQLESFIKAAESRKKSTLSNEAGTKIGVIIVALSGLVILFSLYLLLLGGKASGFCSSSPRTSKHHYDHYDYTVDGKEYWTSINVSKYKPSHEGETKTIHYFPPFPWLTFDNNAVWLAVISLAIGAGFIAGSRRPNEERNDP